MIKRILTVIPILSALWSAANLFPTSSPAQEKRLAEIYKTGKIRLIPEITITDEAMNAKDFFAGASDVALDGKGDLYVCDGRANNIKKFSAQGKYLKTIGKQGQGPGDFNNPIEMEISGARLYVRELYNQRISVLDSEGNFIRSVPFPIEIGTIWWRIAAIPGGRFILERERANYDDPNAPQECFIELYSLDLEPVKIIYQRKVRRNKYITEPQRTNVPIPFSPRVHWDVTPDGEIVIGFSEKYEVEIYDPVKGKLSAFSRPYKPVEVTAEAKDLFFRNMTAVSGMMGGPTTTQRGAPDFIVKNTEFPKYYPPYNDLKVDSEGNIWVRPYVANAADASRFFDVFDRDGEFINRVRIEGEGLYPGRTAWTPKGFWTITMTKDEEYKIVKYKISE